MNRRRKAGSNQQQYQAGRHGNRRWWWGALIKVNKGKVIKAGDKGDIQGVIMIKVIKV
jgi:hypothetical protein